MTDLHLPADALVILVGAAGAGKSTLARRHFPPDAVLSSDAFRARLGSGEADQSVTRAAFAALHRELEDRLARGRLTVIDATSVTPAARAALLGRARRHGRPVVGIVLALPAEIVLRRNADRGADGASASGRAGPGRVVPERAVRSHLDMVAALDEAALLADGFRQVCWLRTPAEADGLRLVFDPRV